MTALPPWLFWPLVVAFVVAGLRFSSWLWSLERADESVLYFRCGVCGSAVPYGGWHRCGGAP